jgi:molecular chaperone GrpE
MKQDTNASHKGNDAKHKETAEAKPASGHVTVPESEYQALANAARQAGETWEKYVRLQADFENARKRWEREKQECMRYANEDIVCDLLNIIDDLERTLELAANKHNDFQAFLKGVEMILAHTYELLKRYGVSPLDTVGKTFDPHYHEALMQVEREELPEHTVVEEMQKGYLLNERLIRTAKVKVSRKKSSTQESTESHAQ